MPLAPRYSPAVAALSADEMERVTKARILVLGAGGIGCELLKNLALVGVGYMEVIDLDTIDLSNLNRQFLFQKQHIKQPKATVAKETASAFNPDVTIVAHHADIKSVQFDVDYYHSFDVVLSALDNLETRRWVNKMCVMAQVPLVESGTAGFFGQVQPILATRTECYDCTAHPTPTTFPVCTIRSTPSTPVHCIVWAKNWLFPQLFGEDDVSDDQELDQAAQNGENAEELANLRREARQMRALRDDLYAQTEPEARRRVCIRLFDKIYAQDIVRLLSMEDMWAHRTKPAPLVWATAMADKDTTPVEPSHTLRDRRTLTLRENAALFLESATALAVRACEHPQSFDKDDDDALGFVTAAANLRAHVYHIPEQTRFETKQIAGNIIPAIATTNAIVAGLVVVQALHMLAARWEALRVVSLARRATRLFTTFAPAPPSASCGVCQDVFVRAGIDEAHTTLQDVLDGVSRYLDYGEDAEVSISAGTRLLYDPDFDDNLSKPLTELRVHRGDVLSIADEDGVRATVQWILGTAPSGERLHIADKVTVPRRPVVAPAAESDDEVTALDAAPAPRKRPAEEDAPTRPKRPRDDDSEPASAKRGKRAAEDSVIVLD